ncbi:DUF2092 domain-containing protein [Mesorhizobium sp. YR577]|uniref:DUF2092 domain-containing protein n=1 Tax=Mesorhizobium sp. YR577 TaxID=1884373 RepID=UPI001FCDA392|nr:DUF2092 domain-containing protein [Mesorhizobium sp. YR577]
MSSTLALLACLSGGARAEGDDARQILQAMSDYMAARQTFSFKFQSSIEAVTKDFEKLQFVSSGTVAVHRPDKIHVTRTGGFSDIDLLFDGETLTVEGKNLGAYAQIEGKGSLDDLAGRLANAGIEPPGGDLLAADNFNLLMDSVTDAKHIASAYVDGVECEYLAFRTPEIDWQIWIEAGDKPIPRRYVVTSKHVAQAPQYTVDIRDWKEDGAVASESFSAGSLENLKRVDLSELGLIDELPSPTE